MTKLLSRVDSAATKGARRQAAQSHASMLLTYSSKETSNTTVRAKSGHSGEKRKISSQTKQSRDK